MQYVSLSIFVPCMHGIQHRRVTLSHQLVQAVMRTQQVLCLLPIARSHTFQRVQCHRHLPAPAPAPAGPTAMETPSADASSGPAATRPPTVPARATRTAAAELQRPG